MTSSNSTNDSLFILVESEADLNQRYGDTLTAVVVFLAILAPIGIIGNIIVLVVYSVSKTYRDTNFRVFVLWLAVIDLLSCLTIIPVEMASLQNVYAFHSAIMCKLKCFFQVFFNTVTGLALLIIALERYRKICHPLRRQISRGLAKKIVVIVIVFAVVLCVPAPIMCGISIENKTNIYNTTTRVSMCEVEEKFEHSVIRIIYKSIFTLLLLIISVSIIVMYGLILRMTCIVKRKMLWQTRTCESINVSTRYLNTNDVTNTDVLNGSMRITESNFEQAIVLNHIRDKSGRNDEIKDELKQPNTIETRTEQSAALNQNALTDTANNETNQQIRDIESAVNSDYQTRLSRLRLQQESTDTLNNINYLNNVNKNKQISKISNCGISSKTLIWLILTIVFIATYCIYSILAFYTTTQYRMSPGQLAFYKFLMRIYFINNVINPVIYTWLDKRFRISCNDIYSVLKSRFCFKSFTDDTF